MAGQKNFEVDQNATFSFVLEYKDNNGNAIDLIIHTAAQPSHDWAVKEPITDFTVNANGTLNLLELTRLFCPKAKRYLKR